MVDPYGPLWTLSGLQASHFERFVDRCRVHMALRLYELLHNNNNDTLSAGFRLLASYGITGELTQWVRLKLITGFRF